MTAPNTDIQKHLSQSGRIAYEDLDWAEARRVGLTDNEIFIVTYFSDIEGQTIRYMRDILNTRGSLNPDILSFLTIWNYEEFFHGYALSKLLQECGHPLGHNRIADIRENALITENLKALGAKLFSLLCPETFTTLYMSWGALNELTTLRGYEEIEANTRNPVLKELVQRIAKQERRHFAWYFNSAKERLQSSPAMQKTIRFLLENVWSPVGAGVKPLSEVAKLYNLLFQGIRGQEVGDDIDGKIAELPGLSDVSLMSRFARKASQEPSFVLAT